MTISKEQFGEWRQHPATQFFWKFLKDHKRALTEQANEYFIHGKFNDDGHVLRGQILEVILLEGIMFDTIESFYQELENADTGSSERIS